MKKIIDCNLIKIQAQEFVHSKKRQTAGKRKINFDKIFIHTLSASDLKRVWFSFTLTDFFSFAFIRCNKLELLAMPKKDSILMPWNEEEVSPFLIESAEIFRLVRDLLEPNYCMSS